jgi:maleamate amidohydrolase
MNDWRDGTLKQYQAKGFADRSGYGSRPALLVVDFINGFTDPASPLGGDFSKELAVTAQLLEEFRRAQLPIAYTVIEYEPDYRDAGLFIKKIPSLGMLVKGSPATKVDDRIRPQVGELVSVKKYASAFFQTNVDTFLRSNGVDTVVMTGCTTSGCVRASAVDSLQCGYHAIVVRDGVGDRADGPHEANLFDIDAKYGDVVPMSDVLGYLGSLGSENGHSEQADEDFQRWWNQGSSLHG